MLRPRCTGKYQRKKFGTAAGPHQKVEWRQKRRFPEVGVGHVCPCDVVAHLYSAYLVSPKYTMWWEFLLLSRALIMTVPSLGFRSKIRGGEGGWPR